MTGMSSVGAGGNAAPGVAFKSSPPAPPAKSPEIAYLPASSVDDEDPRVIRCRQCRETVTAEQYRISVQGAHQHTFANPVGVVFEIGCFSHVRSVDAVGAETDEFTWFQGFRWRIALCGRCQVHLGWRFTSAGRDGFYALIIDRLLFGARDG